VGRPALHDTQALLDVALAIAADRGPASVTIAAVSAASGAPSGSLYHRFEDRSALLGQLWLRTTGHFQAGFLAALASAPAAEGCVAAAGHVVGWCRDHPAEARLLLRGPEDLAAAEWPPSTRRQAAADRRALRAALQEHATELAGSPDEALARATLATIDLPLAVVRRHLQAGPRAKLPPEAGAQVEQTARAVLGDRVQATAARPGAPDPGEGTADERRVLMDAFAEAVARDGFATVRLSDVAQRAGIELDLARALFVDELDCATQALNAWGGQLVVIAAGAFLTAPSDPPLAAHRALEAALGHLARTPTISSLVVTDELELLPAISVLRDRYISLFFQLIAGQVATIDQHAPQPLAVLGIVLDGIFAVLRRFAREGRITELPAELQALSLQTLTPFFGADDARRVAGLAAAGSPPR
jgi:AcrR family transcriptional regulator